MAIHEWELRKYAKGLVDRLRRAPESRLLCISLHKDRPVAWEANRDLAHEMLRSHPHRVVGTFDQRANRVDLVEAMLETYAQLGIEVVR